MNNSNNDNIANTVLDDSFFEGVTSTYKNTKTRYLVLRNGYRVSTDDHLTKESAEKELNHWQGIIDKWPDGSKLEIITI